MHLIFHLFWKPVKDQTKIILKKNDIGLLAYI